MNKERLQELTKDQIKLMIGLINSEVDKCRSISTMYSGNYRGSYRLRLQELKELLEWSLGQWVSEKINFEIEYKKEVEKLENEKRVL